MDSIAREISMVLVSFSPGSLSPTLPQRSVMQPTAELRVSNTFRLNVLFDQITEHNESTRMLLRSTSIVGFFFYIQTCPAS